MGCANSKTDKNEALRLYKESKRFIKQAIDSRYALAAAHVSYTQSFRNISIALRQYVEAKILIRWGFMQTRKSDVGLSSSGNLSSGSNEASKLNVMLKKL